MRQGGRERKVWPEPRHPLELEAVLKFMGGFYVERHSHGNPDFHDSHNIPKRTELLREMVSRQS